MLFDSTYEREIEEGSKGIENPLRAYAVASSGDNFSSFTPEEY
jgi:hypothetical protein